MNLADFEIELNGRLHLRNAKDELMYTAEGAPMAVVLHSPGSLQYVRATTKQSNRMIDKIKRKGKTDQTAEQNTADNAEFLADCTVSFENVEYKGLSGRELAVAVYSEPRLCFIAEQVGVYLRETGNFTKPSTTN